MRPSKISRLPLKAVAIFSLIALVALGIGVAEAQRPTWGGGRSARTYEAGKFDYYVMTLSWSPTYCEDVGVARNDPQCRPRGNRRYAFVLHGLWPQFERGWPESCPTADRGFVPRPVADRMLDIMPSDKLVFHEYRKHGTCSGLGVDGYFQMARLLHNKVKIPQRFVAVSDPRMFVSPQDLVKDFLASNPQMKPDSIAVECGGPGNRLKEVRICFTREGEFRSCGRNEDQRKMCSADRMYVPPVREGAPTIQQRIKSLVPGVGQKI